jgi:hypothetical protein
MAKLVKLVSKVFLVTGILCFVHVFYWYNFRNESVNAKLAHCAPFLVFGVMFIIMAWIGFLHPAKKE